MSETAPETKTEEKKADDVKPADAPAPIVTEHQIIVDGAPLRYRVTTGMLPIKNGQTGETEANVFFMAYTVTEGAKHSGARQPLMFSFNGGPGSASVWLHLGALGPKRIAMEGEKGDMPAPPYHVEDNPNTWLPYTDLVFIDPVGTGYSRPTKPDLGKKFWSVQGDIDSIGEFIRLYLSRYERWSSPLFLVGESYGTTRSAGIAGYLIDRGIAFNGIVLVSSVMQFQTLEFDRWQRPSLHRVSADLHRDRVLPQKARARTVYRPRGDAERSRIVRGRRVRRCATERRPSHRGTNARTP
jgi:carboxypeptidase C (cathepsin A)